MSAVVTRSISESVNVALRKLTTNVDGIKAIAVDAKQSSDAARNAMHSNAQIISSLDTSLTNALAQIKSLEARIAALEQEKSTQ